MVLLKLVLIKSNIQFFDILIFRPNSIGYLLELTIPSKDRDNNQIQKVCCWRYIIFYDSLQCICLPPGVISQEWLFSGWMFLLFSQKRNPVFVFCRQFGEKNSMHEADLLYWTKLYTKESSQSTVSVSAFTVVKEMYCSIKWTRFPYLIFLCLWLFFKSSIKRDGFICIMYWNDSRRHVVVLCHPYFHIPYSKSWRKWFH